MEENLAKMKTLSNEIGGLMKAGKKEEAETAKISTTKYKEDIENLKEELKKVEANLQDILYTIPNIPFEKVPHGKTPEDNEIIFQSHEVEGLGEGNIPHWELAKKYNLIDFELGVKISGAGFPIYIGKMARFHHGFRRLNDGPINLADGRPAPHRALAAVVKEPVTHF